MCNAAYHGGFYDHGRMMPVAAGVRIGFWEAGYLGNLGYPRRYDSRDYGGFLIYIIIIMNLNVFNRIWRDFVSDENPNIEQTEQAWSLNRADGSHNFSELLVFSFWALCNSNSESARQESPIDRYQDFSVNRLHFSPCAGLLLFGKRGSLGEFQRWSHGLIIRRRTEDRMYRLPISSNRKGDLRGLGP